MSILLTMRNWPVLSVVNPALFTTTSSINGDTSIRASSQLWLRQMFPAFFALNTVARHCLYLGLASAVGTRCYLKPSFSHD